MNATEKTALGVGDSLLLDIHPLSWTSVSGNFLTKLPGEEQNRGQRREVEN